MIEKGDFLLVRLGDSGSKYRIYITDQVFSEKINAYPASVKHVCDEPTSICLEDDQYYTIVANLGKKPKVSKLCGSSTHIALGNKQVDNVGKVYFFYKPAKEEFEAISIALQKTMECLDGVNLHQVFDNYKFTLEAHNKETFSGSPRGAYIPETRQIILKPFYTSQDPDYTTLVVKHSLLNSFAKALFLTVKVSEDLFSDWTDAYTKATKVIEVDKEKLSFMVANFLKSKMTLSKYIKELDNSEEDQDTLISDRDLFKAYIKFIAKLYKISPKELNLLSKTGKYDVLEELFSDYAFKVSSCRISNSISKYASKNIAEFFAESIAYRIEGKTLPKCVCSLADRTIAILRGDKGIS